MENVPIPRAPEECLCTPEYLRDMQGSMMRTGIVLLKLQPRQVSREIRISRDLLSQFSPRL